VKRTGFSLSIIALALALVFYLVRIELRKTPPAEVKAREGFVFRQFSQAQETEARIELVLPSQTVRFQRAASSVDRSFVFGPDQGTPAPVKTRVDVVALERLLDVFQNAKPLRILGEAPATFGAERMHGTFTVGEVAVHFVLGGDAPNATGPNRAVYLKVDDVYAVVSAEVASVLLREPFVYYDKALLNLSVQELKAIRIDSQGAGNAISLERASALSFQIAASGIRARRARVDALLLSLGELRAESFVPYDTARAHATAARITLTNASGEETVLTIGGAETSCDQAFGSLFFSRTTTGKPDENLGACVAKSSLQVLRTLGAEQLKDSQPFALRFDEFEELHFLSNVASESFEVSRKGSGFRLRKPVERDLASRESELFIRWLHALFDVEGSAPTEAWESVVPYASLHLSHDGLLEETIELKIKGAHTAFRRKSDGAHLLLSAASSELLRAGSLNVSRAEVLEAPGEIEAIALRCGTLQNFQFKQAGPESDVGFLVDYARVFELSDYLRRLTPELWLPPSQKVQTSAPSCVVEGTKGGQSFRFSVLSDALASNASTMGELSNGVRFTAGPELRTWASRIYASRSFLDQDAEFLQVWRNEHLLSVGDGGMDLRGALKALRADEVVHLGPPRLGEGFPGLRYRVRLARDGGDQERSVAFGKVEGDRIFLRFSHIDATFRVARASVEELLR
jgi:Domain of unknown function (DUF4340)